MVWGSTGRGLEQRSQNEKRLVSCSFISHRNLKSAFIKIKVLHITDPRVYKRRFNLL